MAEKTKGMGRGLAAILAAAPRDDQEEFRQIPIELITANPHQPRRQFDEESLLTLANKRLDVGVIRFFADGSSTGGSDSSYSLTTVTPGGILPASMTSVLLRRSRRSTVWNGERSICEYCLAASSSVEMRVVESMISFISSSVSTV